MNIILIPVYLLYPALIIYLTCRYKIFRSIGAVLLCYLGGMVMGNIGILPDSVLTLQSTLSEVSVALALPLLLFSMNIKNWFKIAGKAIISMLFATIAVVAISTFAFYTSKKTGDGNAYQLAGMAIGVYTGGTPNLAAIKSALDINSSTYLLFHTYDTIFSLMYIFFIVSVGQKFFNKFLPAFKNIENKMDSNNKEGSESLDEYKGIFALKTVLPLGGSLLLAAIVIGLSLAISSLFPKSTASAITILTITTLSILLSFIPKVREIKKTFQLGMYIIYVFCFVVASMTDLRTLIHIDFTILAFVFFCIFGSMALHALFSKIFCIDTDTFLVTSVSAICSPPFVPVVAGALKNPAVLLSGITTGIIGYAIGNYLGISLALLLQSIS